MNKIRFNKSYRQDVTELIKSEPSLADEIAFAIALFSKKSTDTRLRTHRLKRRLEGKYSFSVTGEIRIIFRLIGKNTVEFLGIGPHKKVYGKRKRK